MAAGPEAPLPAGLYLVGTPIGNLEDISLRALRVLRTADRIGCEDTRQTQKLLEHYSIRRPTFSLHEHNEQERAGVVVGQIASGASIALVSDAGLPGISDPGQRLVGAVVAAGLAVVPIPGPSAALTALIASGLETASFRFAGFLPGKSGARRTALEQMRAQPGTVICYEAPHRILETLADAEQYLGADVPICLARELTKLHEEFLRGTVSEVRAALLARDRVRGEMVLLFAIPAAAAGPRAGEAAGVGARVDELRQEQRIDEKEALKRVARERGLSKSDVYRELQRERGRR